MHVGVKSIAGHAFTQFGAGIDLNDEEFSFDGGVGLHLALGRYFLQPGVHYSHVQSTQGATTGVEHHDLHYLAQGGVRLKDRVDLFVAGGITHVLGGNGAGQLEPAFRLGAAFF